MSKNQKSKVVQKLEEFLKGNPKYIPILKMALKTASDLALDPKNGLKGKWRKRFGDGIYTIKAYEDYLDELSRWIPKESYQDDVFFHLVKFYWLIDDKKYGQQLQKNEEFNEWMRFFADDWGQFLSTTESLTKFSYLTFIKDPSFNHQDYVDFEKDMWPNQTYKTFNQLFARQTRGGSRPISDPYDDSVIVNPADCVFREWAKIDKHGHLIWQDVKTGKLSLNQKKRRIKFTHSYPTIKKLLNNSKYSSRFNNGVYMHSFLGPSDYHHFRAPVAGKALEVSKVNEKVFLDVVIKDGEFDAPDGGKNYYEFSQTRGIIIIETKYGLVACLPVGMAQVSSVNMTFIQGKRIEKGEDFGFFMFGGSDIILLFENPKVELLWDILVNPKTKVGVHINCCNKIAKFKK